MKTPKFMIGETVKINVTLLTGRIYFIVVYQHDYPKYYVECDPVVHVCEDFTLRCPFIGQVTNRWLAEFYESELSDI